MANIINLVNSIEVDFRTIDWIASCLGEDIFVQRKFGDFGFVFFSLEDKDGFVQFYKIEDEIRLFSHKFKGNFYDNWDKGKKIDLYHILCFLKKKQLMDVPTENLW